MFTEWIDLQNEVLKYKRLINMVVSLRGHGKTSAGKILACQRFRETGTQTVWVRRYREELSQAFRNRFTANFEELGIPDADKYKVNGQFLYYEKKPVINFIVLSRSSYYKSDDFKNTGLMVFDEFLLNNSSIHYMPNEVNIFLEFLNSVCRFRSDFQCLMFGNHMTNYNPYYNYFNITVNPDKDNTLIRKELLFKFVRSSAFEQMAKETRFAHAVEGTPYYDYAYNGEANIKTRDIIKKRPNKAYALCNVSHHFKLYTIYYADVNGMAELYIDRYSDNPAVTLHTDAEEGTSQTVFYRAQTVKYLSMLIRSMCDNNAIYAASPKVAQDAAEIINIFQ